MKPFKPYQVVITKDSYGVKRVERVEYDAEPELDPGAYYRNKEREAAAVQQEMRRHLAEEHIATVPGCKRCDFLERQLEMARYVGD